MNSPNLMRTGQAAKVLGISRQHLNRLVNARAIAPSSTTEGGHHLWDIATLRAALDDTEGADTAQGHSRSRARQRIGLAIHHPLLTEANKASRLAALRSLLAEMPRISVDASLQGHLANISDPVDGTLALLIAVQDRRPRVVIVPSDLPATAAAGLPLLTQICAARGIPLITLP